MMIDRLLYRFGIVRRSVYDELCEAAQVVIDECSNFRKAENDYNNAPKPPVFKLIKGGKS
jgi:hypothetical protein